MPRMVIEHEHEVLKGESSAWSKKEEVGAKLKSTSGVIRESSPGQMLEL